jgi:PKD domain
MLNQYGTPASRTDVIASPITSTQPPHRYNTASPVTPTLPPRRESTASAITPTQPSRSYATASPTTPTPARYSTASPVTPTQPPPRDNTASLTTPTQTPRRYSTVSPITPTPPPRTDTASPAVRFRPPFPDITASPAIRFRPPSPDITASPIIPFRPPVPRITASPIIPFRPPVPPITARPANQPTLNVSPSPPVELGKPVLFEVVLWQPPPPGWSLQYRFDFGDGTRTDWVSERQATHTYLSPGNGSYPVHVEIASTNRDRVMPTKAIDKNVDVVPPSNPTPIATASAPITPSPTPYTPLPTALPTATPSIGPPLEVYLSVDKNPSSVGDSVIFSIATNLPARNQHYRYEVDFGDGSKPSLIKTNSVPHVFKTAGKYTASVTVLDDGSHARADLAILVDGRTPPWLWVYILVGLAVVALAYLVYPRAKSKISMAVPPTFHPHSDWDAPQRPPENLAINYGLYFHPNVSAGQDRLETDGASLTVRRRTQ